MSYHIPILDSESDFRLKENLFCGSAMAAEARVPPTLAVVDVYETASLIGNEFETLIEKYGTERWDSGTRVKPREVVTRTICRYGINFRLGRIKDPRGPGPSQGCGATYWLPP